MCGKRFATCLLSLVLCSLLAPPLSFCEVVLTDEEAQEIMTELENCEQELMNATAQSEGLRIQLDALKRESDVLKTYYEGQLSVAKRWTVIMAAITASVGVLAGFCIGSLAH